MIVEPRRCAAPIYGPDPADSCDDLAEPDSDYCCYHSNPELWDDEDGDDSECVTTPAWERWAPLTEAAYQRYIEYALKPSPIMEMIRREAAAKRAATPWHRKLRIRTRRRITDARIRLSRAIYEWSED